MNFITTTQAAEILGVSTSRVRQLILSGQLSAKKTGRDWLIKREDVEAFQRKPVGYPRGKPRKKIMI